MRLKKYPLEVQWWPLQMDRPDFLTGAKNAPLNSLRICQTKKTQLYRIFLIFIST